MIIRSQLFVIICDYLIIRSQLFVIVCDYLIFKLAAGRLASFISNSPFTALWHILVMATYSRVHIAACEQQQELIIICKH